MSGKPPKGINKYMLEEVFFSQSCVVPEDNNKEAENNPQYARFVDGKYYFNYPDLWYNNISNNKAVALRKIDLNSGSLNLKFDIVVNRLIAGHSNFTKRTCAINISVRPNQSTYAVLDTITRTATNYFAVRSNNRTVWPNDPEKTIKFEPYYDYRTSMATLTMERTYQADPETHYFSWYLANLNEDAKQFFNVAMNPIQTSNPKQAEDGTMTHNFNHIWNREFLFVHASFVNGTTFNYLGRTGEFYTKPSKMYRFLRGFSTILL
jgi:hypothetical protein